MNVFTPKKTKYKKVHKSVRLQGSKNRKLNLLDDSVCGLKITENGTISSVVFEAVRRTIKKKTKKLGTLKINGFPSVPITKKALGLRMGKGSGGVDGWVLPIRAGHILFELNNISLELGKIALHSASFKINLATKIICNYKIK